GTMFLVWLGEQMTRNGVGNGVSMLIFAGIVAEVPKDFYGFFQSSISGVTGNELTQNLLILLAIVLVIIVSIVIVVLMDRAQRRIPIHHSKKATGDRKSTRLNSSHVSISYAVFCLKKKKQYTSQSVA